MLDRVRFVLVRPLHAGNAGSVARAMANCGLAHLTLVDPAWWRPERPDPPPPPYPHPPVVTPADVPPLPPGEATRPWPHEAHAMASGAGWILQHALVRPSVTAAVAGHVLAVGTTARDRSDYVEVIEPALAAERLLQAAASGPVTVLFGPEDKGLAAADLEPCAWRVHIPTSHWHSSLNLSQATLLIGHALFERRTRLVSEGQLQAPPPPDRPRIARLDEVQGYFAQLRSLLEDVGYLGPGRPEHVMDVVQNVYLRSGLDEREVRILRGLLSQIRWALDRGGRAVEGPAPRQ